MNTGQIQPVRTKLHWKYPYLWDVIVVGYKPANKIPRVTEPRCRLPASSNFQRDLFRKSRFSLVYDWQMGLRGKRTPVSGSQSWITFGPSKSGMGSGLFDVLLRPISEVRTYKQANRQFIFTEPFLARNRTMNAYKKPCVLICRHYLSFNPFPCFRKKFH